MFTKIGDNFGENALENEFPILPRKKTEWVAWSFQENWDPDIWTLDSWAPNNWDPGLGCLAQKNIS